MYDFSLLVSLPDFSAVKRRVEQLVFRNQSGITLHDVILQCKGLYLETIPETLQSLVTKIAISDLCRLGEIHIPLNDNRLYLDTPSMILGTKSTQCSDFNLIPTCLICHTPKEPGYMLRTRRARSSDSDYTHYRKVLGIFCKDCVESYPETVRGKYKFVAFDKYKITMED